MDHAEATNTQVTERYLLGDLNAAEADAFEEHFFDCVECADELRVGMRVLSGGRELAREAAVPDEAPVVPIETHRRRRSAWLPAAAAAALILSVTAPLLLRERDKGPSLDVPSYAYLQDDVRAANDVPVLDGNATIVLSFDIPSSSPAYPRYEARVQRPDGPALTRSFKSASNEEPMRMEVDGLSAGPHELVLLGFDSTGKPSEINRHRFIVRR